MYKMTKKFLFSLFSSPHFLHLLGDIKLGGGATIPIQEMTSVRIKPVLLRMAERTGMGSLCHRSWAATMLVRDCLSLNLLGGKGLPVICR